MKQQTRTENFIMYRIDLFQLPFRFRFSNITVVALLLAACGGPAHEQKKNSDRDRDARSDEDAADESSMGGGGGAYEVQAFEGAALCILSADCPAGTHCDLGECVQQCHAEEPCVDGATCSERGRCLRDAAGDVDPAPITEKLGVVAVSPTAIVLNERDELLRLTLTSTSRGPVRYRVVTSAPHIRIKEPRGEFTKETTIELAVDPSDLQGHDVPGTVRVITSLGDVLVDAPIRVGMTGAYEGTMQYSAGDVQLGQAPLTLDLRQEGGGVELRIHHESSLLFPNASGQDTYGRGIYTVSGGLNFTVTHQLDPDAGAERNHFARRIGREISFQLSPVGGGVLEGTFEERVHGLFVQSVTLHGTVRLRTRSKDIVEEFDAPQKLEMPTLLANTRLDTQLLSKNSPRYVVAEAADQALTAEASTPVCVTMAKIPTTTLPDLNGWFECLETANEYYFSGLARALSEKRNSSSPLSSINAACEQEMALGYREFLQLGASRSCSHPLGPAAVLYELEESYSPTDPEVSRLFHTALSRMFAGPLLVAQDDIVQSVHESFTVGIGNQKQRLKQAQAQLSQVGRLFMQPRLLEFMKRSTIEGARGVPQSEDSTQVDFPGFRTLSRYMFVSSVIDGELSALAAADGTRTRAELLLESQQSAVLTLLGAAMIAGIMDAWGTTPPGAGGELAGALTPIADGFQALLHGAIVFGVPEGEIPLAFDDAQAGPTNFEQYLGHLAKPAIKSQATDESEFLSNNREFEQNEAQLEAELASLRLGLEESIADICGTDFDPDAVTSDENWEQCGNSDTGAIAEAFTQLKLRHAEALSAQTRLEGMAEKIAIDTETLSQTQTARNKTLNFIDGSNKQINTLQQIKNVLGAAVKALELASNACMGNGGASVGMGVAAAVLEFQQSQIEMMREKLRQAQQMRQLEETKEIEFITGMANIKKSVLDLYQLEIDIEQTALSMIQTQISIDNLLSRAKRAHLERTRALNRISESPYSDPMYRVLTSRAALHALQSRREAQRWLYRAGRALEYEMNMPLAGALNRAILGASNQKEISKLHDCFEMIFNEFKIQAGTPQEFSTTISVREMLGIKGSRIDEVTGEKLSEGELFRRALLQNSNLDGEGGVGIEFSTNLEPGNLLWSSNVCNDKVVAIRAQIVGDFQGDNEAEVNLAMAGGGIIRSCGGDGLINWSFEETGVAILQAGVNQFGSTKANTTLHGHSVARPNWKVIVPGPHSAPSNADLDLNQIEDIVLEINHKALPDTKQSLNVSLSCLNAIGAGK